jgi:glycosyltransferase involved in cell wall biosynthesis
VKLSVVIPTITGRELDLANTREAYATTAPDAELVIVKDKPNWPAACNEGYRRSKGDIVHFTADDLEPLPGWWQEVTAAMETEDILPAAKVLNHSADGPWDNHGDGPDGGHPHFTRVPIMRRDQWERIGEWPAFNYVADVWVSEKGRTLGIETRMFYSYAFVHHWAQHGRRDGPQDMAAAGNKLAELRAAM